MAITQATVAQARALWLDLEPIYQRRLDECHVAMESAPDWPTALALQAKAAALRTFLKVPEDLENKVELERQQAAQEKP